MASEANLEALYAGLYTLASLYGGSGGTEGMPLPTTTCVDPSIFDPRLQWE